MNLLRFDSESSWTAGVVSLWRDRLRTKPDLKMCLPSGTTPVRIYEQMSHSVRAGLVSFERATVFALDEFGDLALDDPGRTRLMIQRQLIDAVDLPAARYHFLDPDRADLAGQCADYDAAIGGGFDLILLGLGLNGHLGMNEPDSPIDAGTRRADLHASTIRSSAAYFAHGNLPRWGLTVGLKTILASNEVWLLASGEAKAAIVERVLRGEVGAGVPATLLRHHSNCSVFLDPGAAGRIADC